VNGKPRKDYIAYLVSQPNAISMVFKFIWFRTPRSSEVKPYNEWISVSRLRKDIHNFIIIVHPQEFNSNQVLIYSLGRLGEIICENENEKVNPDFILQKMKVNEEIKARDDSNGNSRIPSLQYLSSMALPHNDMMLIKDNTILEPNRISKYLPEPNPTQNQNQNAGKISKRQRRRYKSKHHRKYNKKTRKHRKTKIYTII
jgi:hypothetical protein